MKQQSDAVTSSKLELLCQGEGQNRNHPLYSLESSGHRARKQKTPPLEGHKAKPANTDKLGKACHTGQEFQFPYPELPQTDTRMWARQQSSSFWLQEEQKEGSPPGLLCITILHCALC